MSSSYAAVIRNLKNLTIALRTAYEAQQTWNDKAYKDDEGREDPVKLRQ